MTSAVLGTRCCWMNMRVQLPFNVVQVAESLRQAAEEGTPWAPMAAQEAVVKVGGSSDSAEAAVAFS